MSTVVPVQRMKLHLTWYLQMVSGMCAAGWNSLEYGTVMAFGSGVRSDIGLGVKEAF